MEKVLQYPLSSVPWALATQDGLRFKTNKSTLLHKLEKKEFLEYESLNYDSVCIVDGNALFHSMTEIPNTYSQLAERLLSSLPNTTSVHFVTDTYKFDSIKSAERIRREVRLKTMTMQLVNIFKFLANGNSSYVARTIKMH